MHSQTLQALRGEIEAVATLQLALNRIALSVDDDALNAWSGPRPEDVDDFAADDGSFSREAVIELRAKAADALAHRYKEVERTILGRAGLEALVRTALHTGTNGVITPEGPPPDVVLAALTRSGAIKLDAAQEAAAQVRVTLGENLPAAAAPKRAKGKAKGKTKGKTAAATKGKPKSRSAKKPAARKAASTAKKPVLKKKAVAKKPAKKK